MPRFLYSFKIGSTHTATVHLISVNDILCYYMRFALSKVHGSIAEGQSYEDNSIKNKLYPIITGESSYNSLAAAHAKFNFSMFALQMTVC